MSPTVTGTYFSVFKGKENGKNINEGFDKLHMILLIRVYAFAQIRQVKLKRPVEKYACYAMLADLRGVYSAISSVKPSCEWAPLTSAFFTPVGYT